MPELACPICLLPTADPDGHEACRQDLLGSTRPVTVDLEQAKLHTVALATVGKSTLSGVQKKISVGLRTERATLQVEVGGTGYILKPQSDTFPQLPENEHVCMRIAEAAGLAVPAFGLVRMKDGSWAYLTRRFDRRADGSKVHQEDFCQLSGVPSKEKYDSSAEQCAKLVRRYTSEPGIQIARLFRWLVAGWWCGNGDLHLKNLSVIRDEEGRIVLSPVYDMLSTALVIPDDPLPLPVVGKKSKLRRSDWMKLADHIELPAKAAQAVLDGIVGAEGEAQELVGACYLSGEAKEVLVGVLRARTQALDASVLD